MLRRAVEIFGFEPGAEPGIVDFGLALPKIGLETALNAEMPELEFDVLRAFGEIAPDIFAADVQSREAVTSTLCSNNHGVPALQNRLKVDLRQKKQPRQSVTGRVDPSMGIRKLREPVRAKAVLLPQPGLTPIRSIDCECFRMLDALRTSLTTHAHVDQGCVVGMNGLCTGEQLFSEILEGVQITFARSRE